MNSPQNSKKKRNKDLPWWVELLFVQIGLPDKLLIKILKTKKEAKQLIKKCAGTEAMRLRKWIPLKTQK